MAHDCENLSLEITCMVNLQSWGEKLVDYSSAHDFEGRIYRSRPSNAHDLRIYFYSCFKVTLERFRDSHFTDRITCRQSVKLIRNLEFRASSAQLYVYV